jgi:hypothetical protein
MPWSPKFFLSRSRSSTPYRITWTDEIFKKSDDAEASLCEDRSAFVLRNDIMALIPPRITKFMNHSGPEAQIRGFQELFLYLNKDRSPAQLRQLIHAYFNDSPSLRGHLSQSSHVSPMKEYDNNISVSGIVLSQNNPSLSDGADHVNAASASGPVGRTSAGISDGVTASVGRLQDMVNIDVGQASQKGVLINTPFAHFCVSQPF